MFIATERFLTERKKKIGSEVRKQRNLEVALRYLFLFSHSSTILYEV